MLKVTDKKTAIAFLRWVIHVENWGPPFLIITDDSYDNQGDHTGYNYFKLGESGDLDAMKALAADLNNEYNLDGYISGPDSDAFLLQLRERFPNSEITPAWQDNT